MTGSSKIQAESGILYVRAAMSPFRNEIEAAGSVRRFLATHFGYKEIFAPYFRPTRWVWKSRPTDLMPTNSGALGKMLFADSESVISDHPSHAFVGVGANVQAALEEHDHRASCFYPIQRLAHGPDFSMLLLGCCESSPGFSTVHATQYELNLSQKHLARYISRWDFMDRGRMVSARPLESPGCSSSFGKFYEEYERTGNLRRGRLLGHDYLYVPSARLAMEAERKVLSDRPRFVRCERTICPTCTFRLY